ncbi:MAG TPA: hypothetical protein VGB61_02115 [Pyrinomonadaceae bacterium]
MPRTRRLPTPSLETKDDLLPSIVSGDGFFERPPGDRTWARAA